jgi:hypothetical protein
MKQAPAPTKTQGAFEIEQGRLFDQNEFSPNWPTDGTPSDGSLTSPEGSDDVAE